MTMILEPGIERLPEIKLIGKKVRMSFAMNKTQELWQSFVPRRKEVMGAINTDLYSVEVYDDTSFFKTFSPAAEFEKWAAVRVADFNTIPDGMDTLIIPVGQYAVFSYKGKPSEARAAYQYIYGQWIPNSGFDLDDRPHFALMGAKYRGEHPESEEELWIPVKKR